MNKHQLDNLSPALKTLVNTIFLKLVASGIAQIKRSELEEHGLDGSRLLKLLASQSKDTYNGHWHDGWFVIQTHDGKSIARTTPLGVVERTPLGTLIQAYRNVVSANAIHMAFALKLSPADLIDFEIGLSEITDSEVKVLLQNISQYLERRNLPNTLPHLQQAYLISVKGE